MLGLSDEAVTLDEGVDILVLVLGVELFGSEVVLGLGDNVIVELGPDESVVSVIPVVLPRSVVEDVVSVEPVEAEGSVGLVGSVGSPVVVLGRVDIGIVELLPEESVRSVVPAVLPKSVDGSFVDVKDVESVESEGSVELVDSVGSPDPPIGDDPKSDARVDVDDEVDGEEDDPPISISVVVVDTEVTGEVVDSEESDCVEV